MLSTILQSIDHRRDAAVELLKDFLGIPSISTKTEHVQDMLRCATWVCDQLSAAGLTARVMPTKGHPVVVAQNNHQPGRPTVLLYGHYDVQPPENDKGLDDWKTPPFQPTIRKDDKGFDAIFARGAVDDKGQVACHLDAISTWQAHGGLPINLTVLIEGEEEIGSANLETFVKQHRELLQADICVISDTGQYARGTPAICYALRGLVYQEIRLTGPSHDLHSGACGGAVQNPANALVQILATLHNPDGTVNIPGFYDDVIPLTDVERNEWNKLPKTREFSADIGLTDADLTGEQGYSTLERVWARPTCDINGLTAGYQGQGAKTVIGNVASAKVSMRLVPNQNPHKIEQLFRQTIRERLPRGVTLDFTLNDHNAWPVITPRDSQATQLAAEAMTIGFGVRPVFIRGGGTIPVVAMLKQQLGLDTLLIGFGLPDDRVHAPNEKFDLDCFHKGRRTAATLYEKLATLKA